MKISYSRFALGLLFWPCVVAADFESNRLRTDGLLHRLRERLEKPTTEFTVLDSTGSRYRWDGRTLSTFLYDENANLSIPSTVEAALVEARAKAFADAGMADKADELYAALQAMDGRYFPVTADVRAVAKRVPLVSFAQPVVLLDEGSATPGASSEASPRRVLHIISDETGIHLRLPVQATERIRLLREATSPREDRTGYVLRLAFGKRQAIIFLDRFLKMTSYPDEGSYAVFSDLRRGFDTQRKNATEFKRDCENGVCTISFYEKGVRSGWQEVLGMRQASGFVLAMAPPADENRSYLQDLIHDFRARTGR